MRIQSRLTLIFTGIVAVIMLIASFTIYYLQYNYRQSEIRMRLATKARNYTRLLVTVAEVDSNLLRIIDRNDIGALPNEQIQIFDNNFNRIYRSSNNQKVAIDRAMFNSILAKQSLNFEIENYEGIGQVVHEHNHDYVVIAAATDLYGLRKLSYLREVLLLVYGISIIVVLISGRIFAGKALEPVTAMIKQVDSIDYTSLSSRLKENGSSDEMSLLAQTFNKMLERLSATFKVQRDFVANASHELRTPLTSITGQLEVVLMKERSNEEYRTALESVLDDITNLGLTSNRLLMLAQASSKMTEFSFAPTRIDEVLWQSQAELLKRRPDYKIEINFYDLPEDDTQLTVNGNDQLLKTMATNLMENGCKYSSDNTVQVQLSVYRGLVQLIFSDQGIGIAKEDLVHIFEPFYRSTNAITVKGHGLGLSLVRRIVDIHNGKIKVLSEPGVGSAFIITFPLYNS